MSAEEIGGTPEVVEGHPFVEPIERRRVNGFEVITLSALIIFFELFKIKDRMPIYLAGALLWGFVTEVIYFIIHGTKEISELAFIRLKKFSFKYLFFENH